jgi:hypothetical protein
MRAFEDFNYNKLIIGLSLSICISIACFNAFGVTVTKNASSAQRSTIDTSRTMFIWIFFLGHPIDVVPPSKFSFLQLFGFLFMVCGTLVYNEIVVIPYLGFDQNTKAAIEKRKRQELLDGTTEAAADPQYMAVSPHAAYDATRNQRNIDAKTDAIPSSGRIEGNLNKSEITVEEISHKSQISFQSGNPYNKTDN